MGIREWFSLGASLRTVTARSPERHALVLHWWAAARARLRVAERLDPQFEMLSAIALQREGVIGLAGAAVAAIDGDVKAEDTATCAAAFGALERVWPKLETGVDFSSFDAARALLNEQRAIDAAPPKAREATAACRAVDVLASSVERAIVPRPPSELRYARLNRVIVAALVVVAAGAWLVPPLFRPKSLAMNKPVKVSSSRESEAPPGGGDVVNGKIEHTYGMQTNEEDNPWVLVDLQHATYVGRIVVFNRGDGWFDDCLPLIAEVGDDEQTLHVVETREQPFSQQKPWEIALHKTIRFIRLSKKGHGYITLAEIAAYPN